MIEHVKQYRESAAWLENYRRETMPQNRAVFVDGPNRYNGFGVVYGQFRRPDTVDVVVKGGLIVSYPLECVRPTTEDERKKLPKWIKKAGAKV